MSASAVYFKCFEVFCALRKDHTLRKLRMIVRQGVLFCYLSWLISRNFSPSRPVFEPFDLIMPPLFDPLVQRHFHSQDEVAVGIFAGADELSARRYFQIPVGNSAVSGS